MFCIIQLMFCDILRQALLCITKLFLFFKLIYFNWSLITLQYCGEVFFFFFFFFANQWHEPASGAHVSLSPETLSCLLTHPISLGGPSALALSALFHVSNLDWSSISHMVIYMFQSFSVILSNHPTLAFSHRIQKSVLYISFAVLHIRSSLPSF